MSNSIKPTLTITAFSYRDKKGNVNGTETRSQLRATMVQTSVNDEVLYTKNTTTKEISKWEQEGVEYISSCELELAYICNQLLIHLNNDYADVQIYTSERALPKLLDKFNKVMQEVSLPEGRNMYETETLQDYVTYLLYDLMIFNTKIKSMHILEDFMMKFVPLIYHLNNQIKIKSEVYQYHNNHRHDIEYENRLVVWDAVKTHVLASGDAALGLTQEEINTVILTGKKRS